MEITRIFHAPNINFQPSQAIRDLSYAAFQRIADRSERPAAIRCAERFGQARRAGRENGIGASTFSAFHNFPQKIGCHIRHIAGHNQVPLGTRNREGCVNARKGPSTGENVFNYGITKVTMPVYIPYDRYSARYRMYFRCNAFHQCSTFERQQRLIAAHAGTPAACQDETRADHAEMITLKIAPDFICVTEK
jgi:hypothetical protein